MVFYAKLQYCRSGKRIAVCIYYTCLTCILYDSIFYSSIKGYIWHMVAENTRL
jgi:hypothetical protein